MFSRYHLVRTASFLWFVITSVIFITAFVSACDEHAGIRKDGMTGISSSDTTKTVVESEKTPIIIAFGDSLTAGLGVAFHNTYPAQLQKKLRHAGFEHRVYNMGISGETTAGALRRLEHILELRPSIVILEFGANDGLRGLDIEQTQTNLAQIIERFHAQRIIVVLAGMRLPPNYGISYTQAFTQVFFSLAKTYNIPFMPFFLQDVATESTLNQPDGIHPTARGYSVIVENLWRILLPVLE